MATYQISPPENFNFRKTDDWPKWIRRFERFRLASGLVEKDEESQVNALIYTMGDEADDVLSSFSLTEEERKKYKTVKDKFESYFVKKRNKIFERAKFNQRIQLEGEPVSVFITALHSLAEHCEYGTLTSEMIRDRIVVGIRNSALSEQLQLDSELSLEKAINKVRQSEAVKEQQIVVRPTLTQNDVSAVSHSYTKEGISKEVSSHKSQGGQRQPSYQKGQAQFKSKCQRCGKSPYHSRFQCPAKDSVCHKCKKRGHYQVVCQNERIQNIEEEFLDGVFIIESDRKAWNVVIEINDKPYNFKIDTGADVTVIPENVYQSLKGVKLQPTTQILKGAGSYKLKSLGKFQANLRYKGQEIKQDIFVIKNLVQPLLGCPAIEELHLIKVIDAVRDCEQTVTKLYPHLFNGLGTLKGEYYIKLKDGAKPYAVATPRRVPLPLMSKVKEELNRMENAGVIRKVDEAVEWCAGMVVVPKGEDKVQICVDLTKLNEQVLCERLPSVEHLLGQLDGTKVFSKLDANSGFWQVKLASESAPRLLPLLGDFVTIDYPLVYLQDQSIFRRGY